MDSRQVLARLILTAIGLAVSLPAFSAGTWSQTNTLYNITPPRSDQCQEYLDNANPAYTYKSVHATGSSGDTYCRIWVYTLGEDPCEGNGTWDNSTGVCEGEQPPVCGEDDGKTPEQCACEDQGKQYFNIGGCGIPDDDDDQTNDRDQCEASGGTYGSYQGSNVCLDEDYGAPQCASSGNIATYQDSDGGNGWACEPDSSTNSNESDIDNDGIPDSQDSDIDNDGVPNSYDDDVDGDGTPNASDPKFLGVPQNNETSDKRLDKLIDLGTNRNKQLDDLTEDVSETKSSELRSSLDAEGVQFLDDAFGDAIDDNGSLSYTFENSEMSFFESKMNTIIPNNGCTDFNTAIVGMTFSITCSGMQPLRNILSWVFYVFTAWFLFTLITTPVNKV